MCYSALYSKGDPHLCRPAVVVGAEEGESIPKVPLEALSDHLVVVELIRAFLWRWRRGGREGKVIHAAAMKELPDLHEMLALFLV